LLCAAHRGPPAGRLNNLGLALRAAGRHDEAITACQDAIAIKRETGDGAAKAWR